MKGETESETKGVGERGERKTDTQCSNKSNYLNETTYESTITYYPEAIHPMLLSFL